MNPYIGKTLGGYQLLSQIGQGGMATVFKAYQPSMDRYVAVKILPAHFTQDRTFIARFEQEARTLAHLEHPHILPVHDYGEQEGITYLVMRYIEGGSLNDLIIKRGPLPLDETGRVIGQIGRALGYAHSYGVIHRDVKPSNVLLDAQGNAFLMDFGIAKLVAGTARFTNTGAVIGTPAYMAPEQGMGQELDHRCDIYALGIVLYEMVTGHVPFDAETPLAVLLKHVHDPLPLPRSARPDLPEPVERIILKALAKRPEDRFQTAAVMAETLEKVVAGAWSEEDLPQLPGEPTATMPLVEGTGTKVMPSTSDQHIQTPITAIPSSPFIEEAPLPTPTTTSPRKSAPWLWWTLGLGGLGVLVSIILAFVFFIRPYIGDEKVKEIPVILPTATARQTDAAIPSTTSTFQEATPVPLSAGWIIDNADAARPDGLGFEIESGDWSLCENGDCRGVCYGMDFLYAEPSCEGCTVWYSFEVPTAGEYEVWAWWPMGDDRATDTPFMIFYGEDGEQIVFVDQRNQGNTWSYITTIVIETEDIVNVLIMSSETGYANADAVALTLAGIEPIPPTTLPVGSIESGWSRYTNANFIQALAHQGDYLWLGGSGGGLTILNLSDFTYETLDVFDGLPSTQINDLLLDGDGNLWIATDMGLVYDDEEDWWLYDKQDGLDSAAVQTLFLDQDGILWAGTRDGERGLNVFDGTTWNAPVYPPLPDVEPNIQHLAIDQNDGIWAVIEGDILAYFDGSAWQTFTMDDGLIDNYIHDIFIAMDGTVWAAFSEGAMWQDANTGEWNSVSQLEGEDVYAIMQTRDGDFWFTVNAGVLRYIATSGEWEYFESEPGYIPEEPGICMFEDDAGLWVGTAGGGLALYDGNDWESWWLDKTVGGNNIYDIQQDGSGAIWFSHPGSGLTRYDPVADTWTIFTEDDGASDWPYYLGVDLEGQIWIGEYESFLKYNGSLWEESTPESFQAISEWHDVGHIFQLAFTPDGMYWVCTEEQLLSYNPATDDWVILTFDDHPVFAEYADWVYVAPDGTVWTTGIYQDEYLLAYFDGHTWQSPTTDRNAPEYIHDLVVTTDGSLWVAGDDLYHLDGETWSVYPWADGYATTIAVAPDGGIWVGGYGLGHLDPVTGNWQSFFIEEGLISENINALYVTDEGIVWIGTTNGVSRYVP
ncbi:MAG: protein kinase [Anaerolineae bacterium]|nr:protein kinase [Anaerolineae bacterium]